MASAYSLQDFLRRVDQGGSFQSGAGILTEEDTAFTQRYGSNPRKTVAKQIGQKEPSRKRVNTPQVEEGEGEEEAPQKPTKKLKFKRKGKEEIEAEDTHKSKRDSLSRRNYLYIGDQGSGKSAAIKYFVLSKPDIQWVLVASGSEKYNHYYAGKEVEDEKPSENLREGHKKGQRKPGVRKTRKKIQGWLPKEAVFDKADSEFWEILEEVSMDNPDTFGAFVVDDELGDTSMSEGKAKHIAALNRHIGADGHYAYQRLHKEFDKSMRQLISMIIIFRHSKWEGMRDVYESYGKGYFENEKDFMDYINELDSENHEFYLFDTKKNYPTGTPINEIFVKSKIPYDELKGIYLDF